MSLAAGGPDPALPRPLVGRRARSPIRGVNLLAELEALVVLGAGRFDVGVHHVLNVFRGAPIAERSGRPVPNPFLGRIDHRHWSARIYDEDAYLLVRMASTPSLALSHVIGAAWPHVAAAYRERIRERLAELPDDALARAWQAAGGPPHWSPPTPSGAQTHFVALGGEHDAGVLR